MAVNVGTSAAIRAVEPANRAAPLHRELWRYLVDDGHVVSGAAFSGGGNLYAWLRQVTTLPAEGSVEAELAAVPPGSRGVVVMPYHAGSRPPLRPGRRVGGDHRDLPGHHRGRDPLGHSRGRVLPARRRVRGHGHHAGGGAGGGRFRRGDRGLPWWQQTLSDVLGRPVRVVDEPEASARGAALLALGLTTEPATVRVVEPRPDAAEPQRAARALHEDLAARLGYA